MNYINWAAQDPNTSTDSAGKGQAASTGAAKSAAESGGSPAGTAPENPPRAPADAAGEPAAGPIADETGQPAHEAAPGPAGTSFTAALDMLARLPLSDAERAEAVRRLLAGVAARQPE
ncbi:MAG: hypothetical protein PVJ57_09240 [Phycisphaerae bacterium]